MPRGRPQYIALGNSQFTSIDSTLTRRADLRDLGDEDTGTGRAGCRAGRPVIAGASYLRTQASLAWLPYRRRNCSTRPAVSRTRACPV